MLLSQFITTPSAPKPENKQAKMNFGTIIRQKALTQQNTEAMCAEIVSKDGLAISKVKHQTPDLCLLAVKQNWEAIRYCKFINKDIITVAVMSHPRAALYLPKKTEYHFHAINTNPACFLFIQEPSEEVCCSAIQLDISLLRYIPARTHKICFAIVKARIDRYFNELAEGELFQDIPLTEELLIDVIQYCPPSVADIPEDMWSASLASKALDIHTRCVAFIPHKLLTAEMCDKVMKSGAKHLYSYAINKASKELVIKMINQDGSLIELIDSPTEEMVMSAIHKKPSLIRHAKSNVYNIWVKAGRPYDPKVPVLRFLSNIQRRVRRAPPSIGEVEDPITMDIIPKGTICGFLRGASGGFHLAGTIESILEIIQKGFRDSSFRSIFVPHRNALVEIHEFSWFLL